MSTIDRYIVGTFLRSYLILLALFIGLYIFADLLANLDEFTEDPELSTVQVLVNMVDYYGYNLPLYYHQLGGILMTFAGAFTFAILLWNNEMTALVAAGTPLQRLAVPTLVCSVFLVAAWMFNSEVVVPRYADKIARHHDDLAETRTVDVRCVRDDRNAVLTAQRLYARQGRLEGVYIIEPDAEGNPRHLIRADGARYDRDRHTWILARGVRQQMAPAFGEEALGPSIRWEPLDEYRFGLNPDQILLRQSSEWAGLLSIRQMSALLESENLPNRPAVARMRDIRFTQPLLAWILLLLAVPFFLTREPANVLVAGGKALLLTGGCFAFAFMSHSMTTDPAVTRLAVWLPVLVFGPVAVVHLANVKT